MLGILGVNIKTLLVTAAMVQMAEGDGAWW